MAIARHINPDSIVQNFDERRLSKTIFTVKVTSFRGSSINDMYSYLVQLLQKRLEYVILAVSISDCVNQSSGKVLEK